MPLDFCDMRHIEQLAHFILRKVPTSGLGLHPFSLPRVVNDSTGVHFRQSNVSTPCARFESLRGLLGRALLPRLEVRQKHPLQAIAKRPTDAEHCRKVVAPRTGHELALVGRTGDLVQVAADAPKLTEGALEGH